MKQLCRNCAGPLTYELIDLGHQPLSNNYLDLGPEAIAGEKKYPLRVMICDSCFLVQVEESVPAEAIFHHDYAYFSSYSASWVDHARRYADAVIPRFGLSAQSEVIEVASNDGYLLQHFIAQGIQCLGIEPAGKCAEAARAKGINTVVEFFSRSTAHLLTNEGHSADLVIANNVLAHVPDINDFVAGFSVILKDQGVATFEFPHLLKMIAGVQFDTIYHEHYSYLSLRVVELILRRHGLRVFDVECLKTHGGSIRVFVCRETAQHQESATVEDMRQAEEAAQLDRFEGYSSFAGKTRAMRDGLRQFLDGARVKGHKVAGYGAAAKGNTFLNFCGASEKDISFVVDKNPEKQGKLLPGSHIRVLSPEALARETPRYVLILPWNLAEEVAGEHGYIAEWGGSFVVASPELREL